MNYSVPSDFSPFPIYVCRKRQRSKRHSNAVLVKTNICNVQKKAVMIENVDMGPKSSFRGKPSVWMIMRKKSTKKNKWFHLYLLTEISIMTTHPLDLLYPVPYFEFSLKILKISPNQRFRDINAYNFLSCKSSRKCQV